jgi:thioredoxin-related protein
MGGLRSDRVSHRCLCVLASAAHFPKVVTAMNAANITMLASVQHSSGAYPVALPDCCVRGSQDMNIRSVLRLALFLLSSTVASVVVCNGFPKSYQAQSGHDALVAASESGKPIMIYFSQTNCIWCQKVEHLLKTSEMRFALIENYHFINVDIGRSGEPAADGLKKMFKVRGTPAFAFLAPKGDAICMVYGNIRDDDELARINSTVQALFKGAKATGGRAGFPSCRSRPSSDERLITQMH